MNKKITFNRSLQLLGHNENLPGIKFVAFKNKEDNPDIIFALEKAEKYHATAVYFRYYPDNKPPKPVIYIYDKSTYRSSISNADIHHMLWNAGVVPICFIYEYSKILVYNCSKKPEWDNQGENFTTPPSNIIDLLSEISKELDTYNFKNFDSGLFWESKYGKLHNNNQSAYEELLKQLKNIKSKIIEREGVAHATLIKKILMMLILIKYLEERKDDKGNSALKPDEFYKPYCNDGNASLESVLKDPRSLINMFDELSSKNHFNGRVFYLDSNEKEIIKNDISLDIFRMFVRGDVSFTSSGSQDMGQMSFWRLYQFSYLPIELISHIYEDFLTDHNGKKKEGVVYTPPSLVQLLIDKAMPMSSPKMDFKILDPACGSGIFLVGAYKRMIQWWRLKNNWAYPKRQNIEELKCLLKNNIYGCDIEPEAVTLTYFSLSLALLDALSPKEIWENVHFDNLTETNLFADDFFKVIFEKRLPNDFQLVIGNPPFKSSLSKWGNKVNKFEKEGSLERPDLPDKQISLLFLEQSMKLLNQNDTCFMIMPSGPTLYNVGSHEFKKYIFEKYYAKEVYDFSALRTRLFKGSSTSAKPAVIAIALENSKPMQNATTHYIFRWTRVSGEKIEFEIDHYDIHKIPYKLSSGNSLIWQTNFFGGGRLHNLMNRISDTRTLGEYLDSKVKENGWKVAEGWIESKGNKEITRVNELAKIEDKSGGELSEFQKLEKKLKADWITGHNFVETEDFTENGILATKTCDIEYFLRNRRKNKRIFSPPHIIIKETPGVNSIPIELINDYLTFKNEIIGIHGPAEDIELLESIVDRYKDNKSYSALLWLLSGRIITNREGVVLKDNIMSLPYPDNPLEFNPIEKLLLNDIIDHYSEFRIKGEKSNLLLNTSDNDLTEFGKIYCDILNSIYNDFKPINPIIGKEFIAYPFVLGSGPEITIPDTIDDMEEKLSNLIDYRGGFNLWVKRIVRVYQQNVIIMYKPNQKRYWLPSIAVRDADETFVDLFKQGK